MKRQIFATFLIIIFCAGVFAETAAMNRSNASAIRVTPPAPVFTDSERQTELARRRAKVFEAMNDNSMMILLSSEPRLYSNSVYFLYRQENNLYYLTNLKQKGAMLVLTKNGGNTRETLFLPKRNPASEIWDGKMYSREDATRISGLKTIVDSTESKDFLQAVREKKPFASGEQINLPPAANLYLLLPQSENEGNAMREFRQESDFSKTVSGYKIENARPIFAQLRLFKSPMEIKLMQHAVDITTEAQMRSMAMVNRAKFEYEVQAEVEYTFRRRNANYWGYPSIVGCGPNATTLHYIESQGEVKHGELLLMDVGAEYDHYTADVTRTFPVNGKFSKEQAEIYRIVYDAQEAAARAAKPGALFKASSQAVDEVIKQGLTKLGLITAPDATYQVMYQGKPYPMPQFKLWYMHGFGHWLGMNVHDVGDYNTPMQPGMIFTNEPGIYIREDALDYLPDTAENKAFLAKIKPAFEKYKNIGVRIEDDMLVTAGGVEWMTKALPRKLEDVEAFMARASKEFNYARRESVFNPTLAVFDTGIFAGENYFELKPSAQNAALNGQTIRRGWIYSGKDAAYSGLDHTGHSHAE